MKGIAPTTVELGRYRGTIWRYCISNAEGNWVKLQHPATYPDQLVADLITCFSERGDLVLDPMAGSGTTCVVAAQLGRQFLGIEISETYGEIARERLTKELAK